MSQPNGSAETLAMLNAEADAMELRSRNRRVSESGRVYAEGRMERFAYAAECVRRVPELEAENARLREELAMREDSEFTRMDEGITALEKVVDALNEGDDWKRPTTGASGE